MNAFWLTQFLAVSFACRLLFVRFDERENVRVCLRIGAKGYLQVPTLQRACEVGLAKNTFKSMTRGNTREHLLSPDTVVLLDSAYAQIPAGSSEDESMFIEASRPSLVWVYPKSPSVHTLELSPAARAALESLRTTAIETIPLYGPVDTIFFEGMISVPALKGLPNVNATCYLNSTLQALFHVSIFREQVKALLNSVYIKPSTFSYRVSKLFLDMEGDAAIPDDYMHALIESLWSFGNGRNLYAQNDPQEALEIICKALTFENTVAPWMGSIFTQMTLVEEVEHYTCSCDQVNKMERHASFSYRLYPLPTDNQGVRLEDLIFRALQKDRTDPVDDHRDHIYQKQMKVKALPPILTFNVNRSQQDSSGIKKNEVPVNIPLRYHFIHLLAILLIFSGLNMTHVVDDYVGPPLVYDLAAVIMHKGNIIAGHYTCMFRHGRWWYELSDSAWGKNYDLSEKTDFNSHDGVLFVYQLQSTIGETLPADQPKDFMRGTDFAKEFFKSDYMSEEAIQCILSQSVPAANSDQSGPSSSEKSESSSGVFSYFQGWF
jgi:hypothetical protein